MTNSLINNLLKETGLTENEIKIYLTLSQYGPQTYNHTAELAKLNRTTCYAVAKRLIQHGLIKEDLGKPIVQLIAEPPSSLIDRLNKEQSALTKRIELTKRAAAEINNLVPEKNRTAPKLVYIEEAHITDFLYQRAEKWMNSTKQYDSTVWGFESDRFEVDYPDWINWYWTKPASQGITLNLFSDESTARRRAMQNGPGKADFQLIPDLDFTTDIWIYGDYIVLLSLEEHPHYLIELKEPLLAKNFREFFKALWRATEHTWERASKNNPIHAWQVDKTSLS